VSDYPLLSARTDGIHCADAREWRDTVTRLISLLTSPVFSYLPRSRYRLEVQALQECARVFAWTTPLAAVSLYRLVRICRNQPIDSRTDSVSMKDHHVAVKRKKSLADLDTEQSSHRKKRNVGAIMEGRAEDEELESTDSIPIPARIEEEAEDEVLPDLDSTVTSEIRSEASEGGDSCVCEEELEPTHRDLVENWASSAVQETLEGMDDI
jgi:hypothetical protein